MNKIRLFTRLISVLAMTNGCCQLEQIQYTNNKKKKSLSFFFFLFSNSKRDGTQGKRKTDFPATEIS